MIPVRCEDLRGTPAGEIVRGLAAALVIGQGSTFTFTLPLR